MKRKKYKYIIIVLIVIVVLFNIITTITERKDEIPYPSIQYKIPSGYCSCLTFDSDGTFGEYDCDSEPSEMPFSGEYYDKYYYNSITKTLIFKSNKTSIFKLKTIKAKVLEWNEDELIIKVLNQNIFDYSNAKKCATDGKNTYRYVRVEEENYD